MTSIYRRICDEYRKTGALPYDFMPAEAGMLAVRALQRNDMPVELRRICVRMAYNASFGDGKDWGVYAPIWFAREFRQEVAKRIEAGEITAQQAARRGMDIATHSEIVQAVQIGMLLMGFGQDDLIAQVMDRLALHSDFTLLAIYAVQNWQDRQQRIFRWLRQTDGCGTLLCAMMLKPETDEQRHWLLFEGMQRARPCDRMAEYILRLPSMMDYMLALPDSAENFHALARLACFMPADSPKERVNALALKLLQGLPFAEKYIDLCAMHRLQRVLLSPEDELYHEWVRRCDPLRWKLRRQGVIEAELDAAREDASLLALVLTGEKMLPPLERFMRLLAIQELPEPMLRFFLMYHGDVYAARLLECLLQVSPKSLFSDAPSAGDCHEKPEGKYDAWLALALSALEGDPALDMQAARKCLGARSMAVRLAAVRCLDVGDENPLPPETEQALRQAVSQEPEPRLRRQMQRLLGGMNRAVQARCRVDVSAVDAFVLENCEMGETLRYATIDEMDKYAAHEQMAFLQQGMRLLIARKPGADALLVLSPGGVVIGEHELDVTDENDGALLRLLDMCDLLPAILDSEPDDKPLSIEICEPVRSMTLPRPGNVRAFPGTK